MQVHLRVVLAAKLENACLESFIIKPAEHLVELLAEHEPDYDQRESLRLYRSVEDTAERLRRLASR